MIYFASRYSGHSHEYCETDRNDASCSLYLSLCSDRLRLGRSPLPVVPVASWGRAVEVALFDVAPVQ